MDVDLLMMGGVNPEVLADLRQEARERLQSALFQQQQQQAGSASTAKIQEAASKIEESVFVATMTREDYERMISARIAFISNTKNHAGINSSNNNSSGSASSSSSKRNSSGELSTSTTSPPLKMLTDEEKQYVIGKLAPLQVHLPKMEKLLAIFPQQPNADLDLVENLRKYAALKGVLQKQLELFPQDAYIVTPTSANSLVEHVHKLTSVLVQKAKNYVSPSATTTPPVIAQKVQPASAQTTKKILQISLELPNFDRPFVNEALLRRELDLLNPTPSVVKVIQEQPDRFIVYLGSEAGVLLRFAVTPSLDVHHQIERGRTLLTLCNHAIVGGPSTIRSVWRHLMYHHLQHMNSNEENNKL